MKTLAIIPARGGSVRIPNKNLRIFMGKPLIAWAILAAKKSSLTNRIIVSTDSPEVAKIAKRYGAEVPFLRPANLSINTIGIEPVLKHAYEWLKDNQKYQAGLLVLLMPTNPLRQPFHIDMAIRMMAKSNVDSVITVNQVPANHTPYWTLVKSKRGTVNLFGGRNIKDIITRSQDFPEKCYARNDLVYALKPQNLYEKPSNLYGKKIELLETDTMFEADINTQEEWTVAEFKFKRLAS